jgi:nicotinate-nucleotide adenylyltransferase
MTGAGPLATRRVGLFGGSFDPVHHAHVALATLALHDLQLSEVRWTPVGHAWQKQRALTPALHRLAMLRLALQHEPRFVLDPLETERTGPSYTIDTVRALKAAHPHTDWFLLIGQDQHAGLHTWRDWQNLVQHVQLVVAARPGQTPPLDAGVRRTPHQVLALPLMHISATDIRARVANNQDISALVSPGVARYIETHGLYRSPSTA